MIGMNRFVTDIAPKADRRRGPLGIEAAKLKFWPKSVHQVYYAQYRLPRDLEPTSCSRRGRQDTPERGFGNVAS
jgi:hypothetical protein